MKLKAIQQIHIEIGDVQLSGYGPLRVYRHPHLTDLTDIFNEDVSKALVLEPNCGRIEMKPCVTRIGNRLVEAQFGKCDRCGQWFYRITEGA